MDNVNLNDDDQLSSLASEEDPSEDSEELEFRQNSINTPIVHSRRKNKNYPKDRSASFGSSVFNLMNAVLGSGILGLSYAMANSGIVLFSIMLVSVALMALFSIHLLLKMCEITGVWSYEDVGVHALRLPGKILVAASILVQNIGAMSSFLFIVKNEFPEVIQAFLGPDKINDAWYTNGDYLVLLVIIVIITPLACLPKIGFLGYTSFFSILCMVFFTIVVIIEKFTLPCPLGITNYNENTTDFNNITFIYNLTQANTTDICTPKLFNLSIKTAYAVPTMAFSFVCHTAVLPIYAELRNPTKVRMMKVATVSIVLCWILYMLSALFGYLTFYGSINNELLKAYTESGHDILIQVVRLAVLLAVICTVPLINFPARKSINLLLLPKRPFTWIEHIICTLFIITLVSLLAIFVPAIKDIFGFAGATSSTSLVFIMPGLFYLFIGKEPFKSTQKIMAFTLMAIGICVLVISLTAISIGLTEDK